MAPDESSVIDPDLPNYAAPAAGESDPPIVGQAADASDDDGVLVDEAPSSPLPQASPGADRVRALVDDLFPAPGHEAHNRPLAERVREFGLRLAEML
jgi:hypothetical protein